MHRVEGIIDRGRADGGIGGLAHPSQHRGPADRQAQRSTVLGAARMRGSALPVGTDRWMGGDRSIPASDAGSRVTRARFVPSSPRGRTRGHL